MTEKVLGPLSGRVPGIWRITAPRRRRGIADYSSLLRANQTREKLLSRNLFVDDYMGGEVRRKLRDAATTFDARTLCAILTLENYLTQAAALPRVTDVAVAEPTEGSWQVAAGSGQRAAGRAHSA
jgi:hypothetical protein